ncbi:hypothetical protein [Prauserella endophytica]|uniref:DivIVA domain-containing protein n=1 Tax=Prauserella endophytica TaxID=1592324 RepID=A0ABY2S068_9PSEU|nr:hypothetical protein [Prauserella endophytica]TKG67038.1 hypothetical protein FCN18_24340 [Prauserella endophytica]
MTQDPRPYEDLRREIEILLVEFNSVASERIVADEIVNRIVGPELDKLREGGAKLLAISEQFQAERDEARAEADRLRGALANGAAEVVQLRRELADEGHAHGLTKYSLESDLAEARARLSEVQQRYQLASEDSDRIARAATQVEVDLRRRLSEVQQQLQRARASYIDDAKTRFVNDREGHYREHELDEVDAAAGAEFDRHTSPVVDDKDGQS